MSDFIDFYQEDPAFWEQLVAGGGGEGEAQGESSAGSGRPADEILAEADARNDSTFLDLPSKWEDRTRCNFIEDTGSARLSASESLWNNFDDLRCPGQAPLNHGTFSFHYPDQRFHPLGAENPCTGFSDNSPFQFSAYCQGVNESLFMAAVPYGSALLPRTYGSDHIANDSPNLFPSFNESSKGSSEGCCNGPEASDLDAAALIPRNLTAGINKSFRFESGAIPIDNDKTKKSQKCTSPDTKSLRCEYPGCRSKRTFKRKYELQRHTKKHDTEEPLSCPIDGCDRKDERAFYRIDKLAHHLKTAHRDDENAKCFEPDCEAGSMLFDLTILHISSHSFLNDGRMKAIRLLKNFSPCHLAGCGKWQPIGKMQEHLRKQHPGHERMEQSLILREMGYDAATCNILCPICSATFSTNEAFAQHVDCFHEARKNEHAMAFWSHMRGILAARMPNQHVMAWKLWHVTGLFKSSDLLRALRAATCPVCGEPVGRPDYSILDGGFIVDHHLQVLGNSSEIRQARREIGRIYPDFEDHPIFNDIKKIAPRRTYIK